MSDAQKVNILFNSMLRKQRKEKINKKKRLEKMNPSPTKLPDEKDDQ